MTLTSHESALLVRIAKAAEPVAMSGFVHEIHPPDFPQSAPEEDPRRVAWYEQQMALFQASVSLWQNGLVQVIHPANGERPDLVSLTPAGRLALP